MPSERRRGARAGNGDVPRLPFDDGAAPPAADPVAEGDEAARAFAVDPSRNVVLEASAGTGKTRVLTTRYVNLLRAGVQPRNILAITFTRKAAAEMRERILGQLRELAGQSPADAARWRDLRDRQGDIAISTIDAFCLSLLREFPLEADLDPGFQVVDEAEAPRLMEEALDAALRASRRLASIDHDVMLLHATLGERRLRAALASLLGRRLVAGGLMRRFLGDAGGIGVAAALDEALGRMRELLTRGEEGVEGFLADGPVRHPAFALIEADVRALESGRVEAPRATFDRLAALFLTRAGKARAKPAPSFRRDDFASPEAWKRHAQAVASLAPYVADLTRDLDRAVNRGMVRGLSRLFRVARWRYRRALVAHAAVDFTEGLARALALLRRMDEFSQSRYRLEARYHHVLVDEFQDTSRAQWALVARLVEAWGEGMGLAHDAPLQPSIFVVGDRKQSIYAFRDADVRLLGRAGRYVGGLRPGGGVRRTIARSFRSHAAILAFVNDLCSEMEVAAGRPDAFRYRASDRFPVPPAPASDERLALVAEATVRAAAEAVAGEIERLLQGGAVRDRRTGLPREARPGDVAVLFRSRESHREFEAALEARGIRSYVYKGLGFFDADEVQDVVALVRFLADPASDLRAAALLRSRFVRLSDPAIARLAPSLAAALTGEPGPGHDHLDDEDGRVLRQARESVASWLSRVDRVPPAELLDQVLAESAYALELEGPRRLQARENLKKLRALARRVQNSGYATWARLADHLDRLSAGDESNAIIDAADAVNLMTVHAAKGLEFAFVFLVNIGRGTGGGGEPVLLVDDRRSRRAVVSVQGGLPEAEEAARERDREETKRLLYVALTRARERLCLAAVLQGGRLRPGRGSLAEVLPGGVVELFERAAGGQRPAEVEWASREGRRHLFRVCRP